MRKVCLAVALLLCSTGAVAESPAIEGQSPSGVLAQPVVAVEGGGNDCVAASVADDISALAQPVFLASERNPSRCSCMADADCAEYSNLWCNDNTNPCNCSSQDRNCNIGQRGYVSCNGVTTYCGPACLVCDPTCSGRSCNSNSDCSNGTCPTGICRFGSCMCVF